MNKPQFTPAPWIVFKKDKSKPGTILANGKVGVFGDDDFPIVLADANTWIKEHKHNSNLIAAAPELYEALDRCLGHLTGGLDGDFTGEDPVNAAREALAKARGEI